MKQIRHYHSKINGLADTVFVFVPKGIEHIQLPFPTNESITPPVVVMNCGDKNLLQNKIAFSK